VIFISGCSCWLAGIARDTVTVIQYRVRFNFYSVLFSNQRDTAALRLCSKMSDVRHIIESRALLDDRRRSLDEDDDEIARDLSARCTTFRQRPGATRRRLLAGSRNDPPGLIAARIKQDWLTG